MEFRVLGPLEVSDEGAPLALGGPRQRLVLGYLVLDANRVVPTDRLIDQIWGDEPPDAARQALFSYVSRLRKLLGAGRIQARPPGYVLVAERREVDALRFADLVEEARRATADPEAQVARLTEALDLWRGGALSDLADFDALRPAITRLEELRLGALEDRAELEIDLGRHREAVPQLEGLTREYPLRERLWGQLMLALYRSGRQGDALAAFHRARNTLVEELGIDPSPDLRRIHEQVLQQDPSLDLPRHAPPVAPPHAQAGTAPREGGPPRSAPHLRRRRLALVSAGVGVLVIAVVLIGLRPKTFPPGEWTISVDLPLSGGREFYGISVRNAVEMAVADIDAAGGIDGSILKVVARDDAGDPARAAKNASAFVDDPNTIAMIGPWASATTFDAIPITNAAGLLECSPSATHPGLTKPRDGALDLRAAHPEAVNFLRLPPADDIQARASASFAYRDLFARRALVVDDTGFWRVLADRFEEEFQQLGGTTVRRSLNPGGDPQAVLDAFADPRPPDLVFFGGEFESGVALRLAMADGGYASTPLLSWDPLLGGAADVRSFIREVGLASAVGTYLAHASLPDHKASFADAFREQFGYAPDEYSAAGYACVEIIAATMRGIARQGPAAADLRELMRAYAADPTHRFETVLGTVGFDANGDALQQFVTFYRVDTSADHGAGDWVIFKKQDFGPAP